ncbi:MAG: metallophosphoesterase [Proteobacteria bacterium]|nr:MAG: metallophosphoesterase [Pseudomonadota bacterium]
MKTLKVVAISDTHNRHKELTIPECDILIHAGDYSFKGYDGEVKRFYSWLNKQPAKYKISIQGNHELGWESNPKGCKKIAMKECPDVILLDNEEVVIEGVKIYGFAETPWFYDWAFNRARSKAESEKYHVPLMKDNTDRIPKDVNILVTHGPPYGILDELLYVNGDPKGQFVGCEDLLKRVIEVKPDVHIFGHIHCGYGEKHIEGTSYYNASICDEMYSASNEVTVIDYLTDDD